MLQNLISPANSPPAAPAPNAPISDKAADGGDSGGFSKLLGSKNPSPKNQTATFMPQHKDERQSQQFDELDDVLELTPETGLALKLAADGKSISKRVDHADLEETLGGEDEEFLQLAAEEQPIGLPMGDLRDKAPLGGAGVDQSGKKQTVSTNAVPASIGVPPHAPVKLKPNDKFQSGAVSAVAVPLNSEASAELPAMQVDVNSSGDEKKQKLADMLGNRNTDDQREPAPAISTKPGVEGVVAKPTGEATGLNQPAQTLLSAIRENTNWSQFLSASTVQKTQVTKPGGAVLQALKIQLNPVELGKIELNLRMVDGQLQIDVRAETEQAYRSLSRDQEALANTIRSLGYKVDNIAISGPQTNNSVEADVQNGSRSAQDQFEQDNPAGGASEQRQQEDGQQQVDSHENSDVAARAEDIAVNAGNII